MAVRTFRKRLNEKDVFVGVMSSLVEWFFHRVHKVIKRYIVPVTINNTVLSLSLQLYGCDIMEEIIRKQYGDSFSKHFYHGFM